jgi:hypothetical protein
MNVSKYLLDSPDVSIVFTTQPFSGIWVSPDPLSSLQSLAK